MNGGRHRGMTVIEHVVDDGGVSFGPGGSPAGATRTLSVLPGSGVCGR